ncbi:MAG: hypothetical protein V1818_02700 [Candidatus Aenigmatarchaeota archaeon]
MTIFKDVNSEALKFLRDRKGMVEYFGTEMDNPVRNSLIESVLYVGDVLQKGSGDISMLENYAQLLLDSGIIQEKDGKIAMSEEGKKTFRDLYNAYTISRIKALYPVLEDLKNS